MFLPVHVEFGLIPLTTKNAKRKSNIIHKCTFTIFLCNGSHIVCVFDCNMADRFFFSLFYIDTAYQNSVRALEEARVVWEKEMEQCCDVSLNTIHVMMKFGSH